MVLDLLEKFIPYALLLVIAFFLWLALRNYNRLRRIRHTGRVPEMIDRRRNFILYLTLSGLTAAGLFLYFFT